MGDEESNDKADANRAAGKTSYPYLKNFLGFKVDDESLKAIPYAQVSNPLSFVLSAFVPYYSMCCPAISIYIFSLSRKHIIMNKCNLPANWYSTLNTNRPCLSMC